jgi:hypothetical protein
LAAHGTIGVDSLVPDDTFEGHAAEYLPILSILLTLWLPGNLQIWRVEGVADGGVARAAL